MVIGNPPYVNIANIKPSSERDALKVKYYSARNKADLYAFFIEKGFEIMTFKGILTYIIPHTWKATDSFRNLREIIFTKHTLLEIVNLKMGVFEAIVEPLIATFSNEHIQTYKISIKNNN